MGNEQSRLEYVEPGKQVGNWTVRFADGALQSVTYEANDNGFLANVVMQKDGTAAPADLAPVEPAPVFVDNDPAPATSVFIPVESVAAPADIESAPAPVFNDPAPVFVPVESAPTPVDAPVSMEFSSLWVPMDTREFILFFLYLLIIFSQIVSGLVEKILC